MIDKMIKMLVMDVDGTLTDGKIYTGANGEAFKAFNVKDGYRIINLEKYGIIPVIITGRSSQIVSYRAKELKIKEYHQGVENKLDCLNDIVKKHNISLEQVAYIGDDLNDLDCIEVCGLSACPADAIKEVKECVDYICKANGGNGAVREFIDMIRKNEH